MSERPNGDPILLQVRPRKVTIWACVAAFAVVAFMVVVGILLRGTNEGVQFRTADQIALIGVGVVIGGAMLTITRPRLRVDRQGLWIRNMLGEELVPWALVVRVSYPVGAPWAQVMMPDDEIKPLMAIQGMDRGRAVNALDTVRALQAQYGPPPAHRKPAPPDPAEEWQEHSRPLGRLEIIDREKAAQRDRDLIAKQQKQARKAARKA
jgi:hypothetical protein